MGGGANVRQKGNLFQGANIGAEIFRVCCRPLRSQLAWLEKSALAPTRAKPSGDWLAFWRQVRRRKRFAFFVSTKPR